MSGDGVRPEVLLTARGLAVGYGGVPVLSAVDVTLHRGECVAVIGANGSGKTTLFRTLAGILRPLAGTIAFGAGRGTPRVRPRLGYVPQRDQLDTTFPLTVSEVVRMGAYRRWRPFASIPAARADRLAAALATVGAQGWERRTLDELSGGQRQRVLIARALIAEPDLLLLDEPTSGIDRASEEVIYAELRRCRSAGLGLLMVSHDLAGLARVADRVLLVEHSGVASVPVDQLRTPQQWGLQGVTE